MGIENFVCLCMVFVKSFLNQLEIKSYEKGIHKSWKKTF